MMINSRGSKVVDEEARPAKRHAAGGAAAQVCLTTCISQLSNWNTVLKPSKHQAGGSDEDGGHGRLDGPDLDV